MFKTLNLNAAKSAILALICAFILCSSPLTAHASNTEINVPSSGTATHNVTAQFEVTDDILNDLGYGAIASVPLTMNLSYNSSTKKFSGTSSVFAYGSIDTDKKVTINADTSSSTAVITDEAGVEYFASRADAFTLTQSKTDWNFEDMLFNLTYVRNGNAAAISTGQISIQIDGTKVLLVSKGRYQSVVPLIIKMEAAD